MPHKTDFFVNRSTELSMRDKPSWSILDTLLFVSLLPLIVLGLLALFSGVA